MEDFITDEEMAELSEDPEQAFVQLERKARDWLDGNLQIYENSEYGPSPLVFYQKYLTTLVAAASGFGIAEIGSWRLPSEQAYDIDMYERFRADVDHETMKLRLGYIRRVKEYSVKLDSETKQKLREFLNQISTLVDSLDVPEKKRDRLYSRINALKTEFERKRTHVEAFAALSIEAAGGAESVVRLLDRVGTILRGAKREEEPQLPAAERPKRIEPPKTKPEASFGKPLDDEIPF